MKNGLTSTILRGGGSVGFRHMCLCVRGWMDGAGKKKTQRREYNIYMERKQMGVKCEGTKAVSDRVRKVCVDRKLEQSLINVPAAP